MSQRACWTDTKHVEVAITDDFYDQYSSTIDVGNVAIVLTQDQDGLVIEGADHDDLHDFALRLAKAIERSAGRKLAQPARAVWSLTIVADEQPLTTTLHESEEAAIESLEETHGDVVERESDVISDLEKWGYTITIDSHEI